LAEPNQVHFVPSIPIHRNEYEQRLTTALPIIGCGSAFTADGPITSEWPRRRLWHVRACRLVGPIVPRAGAGQFQASSPGCGRHHLCPSGIFQLVGQKADHRGFLGAQSMARIGKLFV
jgi:hypothetical protein